MTPHQQSNPDVPLKYPTNVFSKQKTKLRQKHKTKLLASADKVYVGINCNRSFATSSVFLRRTIKPDEGKTLMLLLLPDVITVEKLR